MTILPEQVSGLSFSIQRLNNTLQQPQYNNLSSKLEQNNELMKALTDTISTLSNDQENIVLKAIHVLLEENRRENNELKSTQIEMVEQLKLLTGLTSQMLDIITSEKEPRIKRRERIEATPIKRVN